MIEFRALGALDLRTAEGVEVRSILAQPKRVALLAYLTLHAPAGYVRRDTLLALFWPESTTEHARASLRKGLHFLRRALGEAVIVTRGAEEVGIDLSRLGCDAVEFRRLLEAGEPARALELYRGELLKGFHISAAPEFEAWLDSQRAELREQAAQASWAVAAEAEAASEVERAAEAGRRAVALSRDEEAAVRRLMTLLGRMGDREGALRAYEEYAGRLLREYEAVPLEETQGLLEALRAVPSPGPSAVERGAWSVEREPGADPFPLSRKRDRGPGGEGAVPERGSGGDGPAGSGAGVLRSTSRETARERSRSPHPLRPQVVLALSLLLLLATGAALLARLRSPPAPLASSDLIAVLPFTYHGSGEHDYLSEGIVRLLSTNLDGAGTLRSVDSRVLLGALEQGGLRPDSPESGRALAQRFGAGIFVLGHVIEAGGRLRITAVVYDQSQPARSEAEITVEGESTLLFELVDQLTTRLLAARSATPGQRLKQLAALTTHSIPALKAFLEGEQAYRAARYGAALDAFRRAVAADSTFALAYYRMSTAAVWTGAGDMELAGRVGAMRFRDRLAPRDRRLVEAWDRQSVAYTADAEPLYEAVLARYPDDFEAWMQLAEARFHWKPMFGHSVLESRAAFERVLGYEPDNAPALIHLARLAALERRLAAFDTLAARLLRNRPDPERELELAALRAALRRDNAARAQVLQQLGRVEPDQRLRLVNSLVLYANDLEGAVEVLRPLSAPERDAERRAQTYDLLAVLELARGRWRAVQQETGALARFRPAGGTQWRAASATLPLLALARPELEAIRGELLHAPLARVDELGLREPSRLYLLGRLSVRLGDPLAALGYAAELERLRDAEGAPWGQPFAALVRAEVARQGGQGEEALRQLGEPRHQREYQQAGMISAGADARWLRAELLREVGREEEALRWYASFPDPSNFFYDPHYLAPSHLRRAEIYERRGEHAQAAEHYRRFVELWQDTDPELQPLVEQARGRLGDARRTDITPPQIGG
jgi:DNA-binding SARP family transcriptional activator/TolB-like protein